jgi:hypothetical protein
MSSALKVQQARLKRPVSPGAYAAAASVSSHGKFRIGKAEIMLAGVETAYPRKN